ncbi:MAG: hypothetical protein P8J14_04370 [Emcibacteraceae bacterium]|nr:hypothetical protein [Emcibacteraceae bacterium]
MTFPKLKTALGIALMIVPFTLSAQEDGQEQLFKNYQAMVIVEEYNQHCPMLSRLEAEALNGQIVFANGSFSGSMDKVEKFKKEARIFARRMQCNAPELQELYSNASQQASDFLVNHILLARQIHLYDIQNTNEGKGQGGLLLGFMVQEQWTLLDDLYDEVKDNYLSQATEEQWDAFEASILNVAEERTALKFMESQAVMETGAEGFAAVQAKITLQDITSYYHNLEKTVKAFVDGATAEAREFPYMRPANDFTNWTAYRPRGEGLNWAVSYPGCGGNNGDIECTFFTTSNSEVGAVLPKKVMAVRLAYRNSSNAKLGTSLKTVEGPIGSNELNQQNLNDNIEFIKNSDDIVMVSGALNSGLNNLRAQTGDSLDEGNAVFVFPKETLSNINLLHKNDMLIMTITTVNDEEIEKVIPLHNYKRANNWAYTTE